MYYMILITFILLDGLLFRAQLDKDVSLLSAKEERGDHTAQLSSDSSSLNPFPLSGITVLASSDELLVRPLSMVAVGDGKWGEGTSSSLPHLANILLVPRSPGQQ